MAAQYDPKYEYQHEIKWRNIDLRLQEIGFWVKWHRDFITDSHKYAIGLKGEKQPMGIYNDEDTATAMTYMLITNAKDGG
jgi:hypothetical protein